MNISNNTTQLNRKSFTLFRQSPTSISEGETASNAEIALPDFFGSFYENLEKKREEIQKLNSPEEDYSKNEIKLYRSIKQGRSIKTHLEINPTLEGCSQKNINHLIEIAKENKTKKRLGEHLDQIPPYITPLDNKLLDLFKDHRSTYHSICAFLKQHEPLETFSIQGIKNCLDFFETRKLEWLENEHDSLKNILSRLEADTMNHIRQNSRIS